MCAKLCRKSGGDLEQIQFLLGHSSIQMTEKYLGGEQDIVNAVNDRIFSRGKNFQSNSECDSVNGRKEPAQVSHRGVNLLAVITVRASSRTVEENIVNGNAIDQMARTWKRYACRVLRRDYTHGKRTGNWAAGVRRLQHERCRRELCWRIHTR
jgi:hypothetical protein